MRCSVLALVEYFIPKSSTHRMKVVGLPLWRQSPGVNGAVLYPWGAMRSTSWSNAMMAASLRPYMARRISM